MEYLKRLSEWSEMDWSILMLFLMTSLILWSGLLLFIHILIVRRQVKKVQDRYDKLVRPFMFGDGSMTVKENLKTNNLNKENW